MTRFLFYMRASMRVHKRFMTSNLSFKTIVYAIDVCTAVGRCVHGSWQTCAWQLANVCTAVGRRMHACQERTCQNWIMRACKL